MRLTAILIELASSLLRCAEGAKRSPATLRRLGGNPATDVSASGTGLDRLQVANPLVNTMGHLLKLPGFPFEVSRKHGLRVGCIQSLLEILREFNHPRESPLEFGEVAAAFLPGSLLGRLLFRGFRFLLLQLGWSPSATPGLASTAASL